MHVSKGHFQVLRCGELEIWCRNSSDPACAQAAAIPTRAQETNTLTGAQNVRQQMPFSSSPLWRT